MFNRINESFDRKFNSITENTLVEQLEECLNRLNEDSISDEDQRDSDLIRSMIDKMQNRSNAKFTPEENAVLDKYGINRNNDFRNLEVGGRPLSRRVDSRSSSYGGYSNGTKHKINYADRARKSKDRADSQVFPGYGTIKNDEINAHGGSMGSIDTLQDAHNIAQGATMRDKIGTMKRHLWDRKFHQEYVDGADDKYEKDMADAHTEYERRVKNAKKARDNAKTGWHKQGMDSAQDAIDTMLKRNKKNESKSIKESPSYDMHPQYDARQSFYGKARIDDENGVLTLYSYNTPVAKISNGTVELLPKWDWSQTTLRHVKEFLKQNGFEATSLSQMRNTYL